MKVKLVKRVGDAPENQPGAIVDVSESRAARWIAAGIAEAVETKPSAAVAVHKGK